MKQQATDSVERRRATQEGEALPDTKSQAMLSCRNGSVVGDGLERQVREIYRFLAEFTGASAASAAHFHRAPSLRLASKMATHTRQALVDSAAAITAQIAALKGVRASVQQPTHGYGENTPLRIVKEGSDYFLKPATSHSLFFGKKAARAQAEHLAVLVGMRPDAPVTLGHLKALGFDGAPRQERGSGSQAAEAGCFCAERLQTLNEQLVQVTEHIRALGKRGAIEHDHVMQAWDRT
ncbi:hypothetical protein ACPWR0_14160 [Pandoraea pneumonica]|uniref:hypothetical protein n=1 Tax=Pandoraea pneumonica TaxID=2508299 RepID=UPI003CEC5EE6